MYLPAISGNSTFEAGTPGIPLETGTPGNWSRGGADAGILYWSTGNSVSSSHSLGVIKLNTSLKECSRWGAFSFIKVRYGEQNAHSSSLTSLG